MLLEATTAVRSKLSGKNKYIIEQLNLYIDRDVCLKLKTKKHELFCVQ